MAPVVRQAHPSDLPDLYRICHLTSGGVDPVPPKVSDPDLVGQVFVAPYLFFEPRSCFVACDGTTLLGYVAGTCDTRGFAEWMESDWLPAVRERIPPGSEPSSPFEAWLRSIVGAPEPVPAFASEFPAHLHINLLTQARGMGIGRMLVERLLDRLRKADIPGIHLGVSRSNHPAVGFYRALGFDMALSEDPGALFLGRKVGGTS